MTTVEVCSDSSGKSRDWLGWSTSCMLNTLDFPVEHHQVVLQEGLDHLKPEFQPWTWLQSCLFHSHCWGWYVVTVVAKVGIGWVGQPVACKTPWISQLSIIKWSSRKDFTTWNQNSNHELGSKAAFSMTIVEVCSDSSGKSRDWLGWSTSCMQNTLDFPVEHHQVVLQEGLEHLKPEFQPWVLLWIQV